MPIQPFDDCFRRDARQFPLPFIDQVGRRDDERDLIRAHFPLKSGGDVGGNGNRGCASERCLADPHLSNEQDAVAVLQPACDCRDHVLLRGVERVFSFEADAIQPAPHSIKIEAVHRLELGIEILSK